MTNIAQTRKNIELSEELMNYLIASKTKIEQNYSYVVFVKENTVLNRANNQLVKDLLNEGKKVVKAEKTNDFKEPWIFTIVN